MLAKIQANAQIFNPENKLPEVGPKEWLSTFYQGKGKAMKAEHTTRMIDLISSLQAILMRLIEIEKKRNESIASQGGETESYGTKVKGIYEKVECPFESSICFSTILLPNQAMEAAEKAAQAAGITLDSDDGKAAKKEPFTYVLDISDTYGHPNDNRYETIRWPTLSKNQRYDQDDANDMKVTKIQW